MLRAYTFYSKHYNEVVILIAENYDKAYQRFKEIYMPGCEIDDWIIGGSISCTEGQSTSIHIY